MFDNHGRNIEYLRISVTQNCNLKCLYCSPGPDCNKKKECNILTPSDFKNIAGIMAGLGINKIRITGGEPLVRTDICDIIRGISEIKGIEDISMTTNGVFLDEMAADLKNAGLKRLNVSLDSLKKEKFAQITGVDRLSNVLEGIKKSIDIGLLPLKINTVLIKGVNDSEIDDFMDLTKEMPVDVRFIELMPIGRFGEENRDKIIYNSDIIKARPQLIPLIVKEKGAPAQYYRIKDHKGRIGFISPMSHKFCNCCNRIRLTCDGKIKPCLGSNGEVDLYEVINDIDKLTQRIKFAILQKPEGHNFETSFNSDRSMNAIGG